MTKQKLLLSLLRRIASCKYAGVSIIATLAVPAVVGAAAFGIDVNRGYQQRVVNQRVADLAALGAAMAYKASSNSAILDPVAQDIAIANGLPNATVDAAYVANYPSTGKNSVSVNVTDTLEYTLGRVLGFTGTYDVEAMAYASLDLATPGYSAPCYLALFTGAKAIETSGGATINAPNCSVAAVGSIYNASTGINAKDVIAGSGNVEVTYGYLTVSSSLRHSGSFTFPAWNTAIPAVAKRVNAATTLTDPWATNSTRLAEVAQIGTFDTPVALSNPVTTAASNWTFNYSPAAPLSSWWNSSTKTYTVPAGTYNVGSVTISGGITVNFVNGSTINIHSGFTNGGTAVNFGNSDVRVNGGFNSGSSGVTFGNGLLHIGSGTITFNGTNVKGTGNVFINGTLALGGGSSFTMGNGVRRFSRLTIGGGGWMKLGTGNFQANNGVYISGDSEFSMGDGNVVLGKHTDNISLDLNGSARWFMGTGEFSTSGHIDTEGGSKIVIGATPNHYINGNFNVRGAALFGKGRYLINGNFVNGTGGTVWPYTSVRNGVTYGQTLQGITTAGYDMIGVDVTFVLNGTLNLAGGAKTLLYAATGTSDGAIGELLLTSATTSATTWGAGSSSVFAGAVHLPGSVVTMSGGNSTNSASRCFSLIASRIVVSGGAATGTSCTQMATAIGLVGGS